MVALVECFLLILLQHREARAAVRRTWRKSSSFRSKENTYRISRRVQTPGWGAAHCKKWTAANRDTRRKINGEYHRRKSNDPSYRLKRNMRTRVWQVLRGRSKSVSTLELLGCSIEHLRAHLESLFQPGMGWDNYGTWEVDHVKPCASFDLTDPAQQQACFRWSNLQPLWQPDNSRKKNRV